MRVRTTWIIPAAQDAVWPLLGNSQMELRAPRIFLLGIPRPKRCRLPSGAGGVGQLRECVLEEGTIRERILEWEEGRRLRFEMQETDLPFARWVPALVETLDLERMGTRRTRVTRTTDVTIGGPMRWVKGLAVWLGLKLVHRFVFRNWAQAAKRAGTPPTPPVHEEQTREPPR